MRVLIIERTYDGGHYLNYVKYLIQAFSPLGCEVVVALPKEAQVSTQYKVYLSPHRAHFRLEVIPPQSSPTGIWGLIKADACVFNALIDRLKPDAVYFPTADGAAQTLGLSRLALRRSALSQVHSEALLMWMPAAYGMSRRPPFFTKVALRAMPFDVVHYIDPVAYDWVLSDVGGKAARTARFIADPIELPMLPARSQACTILQLPAHKKLIMSIGVQDHRKGVDYLMDACARWQPGEPASIVLAGKLSDRIRELATGKYRHLVNDGRLIILDRFLTNEDFNACFAAGDLIITPYRPHPGPSAIVLNAVAAGKMVLAANNGWFAYVLPKFSLGRLCDPQDPELLAASFDTALHEAKAYKLSAAAKRLIEFHRPENFMLQWRRGLSRIMGKPEATPVRDWKWVLTGEDEKPCDARPGVNHNALR